MKILLHTTQPNWKSWPKKLAACRGAIGLARYAGPVTIDLRTFEGRPPVVGGKVSRSWYNTLTIQARKEGYQAVVLHFSESEGDRWGLDGYKGACINDELTGEMWIISDEDTVIAYEGGQTINRFFKVFVHEMSHWLAKLTKVEDRTHYWDYDRHFILGAMRDYTLSRSIVDTILSTVRKERLVYPLANMPGLTVSQPFGAKDASYKSGIHAGCDYAVPTGTKIYAPADGIVSLTWKDHKDLGNAFAFEFYYAGRMYTMRCAHLRDAVKKGGYRRGDLIGYSGNTGRSTGSHVHMELFRGGYNYDMLLSEKTVLNTLISPSVLFNSLTTKV